MKILVIEDNLSLRESITEFLAGEGYVCEQAEDFTSASEKIHMYDYDIVLVDITLPKGNGLDLVKELKQKQSQAGIIIISAKDSLDDKIKGLDIGSDDYLPKPFHLSELNARVKALVRRKKFEGKNEIVFNEINIDPASRKVTIHAAEIVLTGKEYDLLLFFLSNKNRVLPKGSITEHLWGDESDQSGSFDFLYTHIKNLRKKMAEKGCRDYIHTVYGIGYSFNSSP